MTAVFGFELLREQIIPEINSTALLYRHVKTGAELLSLVNDDENKVFGIAFGTPPADSNGVAHILEHSVLCGSRKYPIKDPFVQLLKGSLQTFLNAFTLPDKTVYPCASQNLRDFYNLIDVYLDAVLYPRLGPHILKQEGWHYELETPDAPLVYTGVVYNEMKGSYSSPDRLLGTLSRQSLFPDTAYGYDSGGDPIHIPDLTYAQFKAFHERHYHPSNARIFFHGDDDPQERLRLVDSYLSAFEPIAVAPPVALQTRFATPRREERTFAASEGDAGNATPSNAMVTINWMLDEIVDVETSMALSVLDYILVGTQAAPLHKALIESGLGGGIAGGGLSGELLRQACFSIGLKDIDPAAVDAIEALVLATLADLVETGIDPLSVEAAMNTTAFTLREKNTGSFPRGIALLLQTLDAWPYGRDPMGSLAFAAPFAAIKARLQRGERYFEELIARYLVANPHRVTMLLRPDPAKAEREAAEIAARLEAVRAAMSAQDLAAVAADAEALKRMQETPDTQEARATIPSLALADLPRENKTIPIATSRLRDTEVLHHDLFTAGIVYLDLGFDLHCLPPDLLPYIRVFNQALLETGAGEQDFVALSQRIGRSTGGINASHWVSTVKGAAPAAVRLILSAKALPEDGAELLAILGDVLRAPRLDDRERIKQIMLQEKASFESALVPSGSYFAGTRLNARFNEAGWVSEVTAGLTYLDWLRRLTGDFDATWPEIAAALARIRVMVANRTGLVCNVTTDAATWRGFEPKLDAFLAGLPMEPARPEPWHGAQRPDAEGLTIPATVNYVAKGIGPLDGAMSGGATAVISRYVSTSYLWDTIRVQGGAYGASCSFDRHADVLSFTSYRDPNLLGTLDAFDGTAGFLTDADLDDAELTRGIIGAIGDIDGYQLPDAKGLTSMVRHLIGETDASLQRWRDEVLATTAADFRALGAVIERTAKDGRVVVVGSETAIAAANTQRPGFFAVSKAL